nr:nucleoprotein [Aspen mosaic-associated virus]WLF82570.1 nucleoprotein [Aspen mosaic-associated virus]WLF82571.1 nucleoprotein [Aspen mosaic-associated virus]WLF82573.1 nucleoprotein [Aspen mosaic-associated virus]WLF82574.1 nucleoprotein [Aspen mosaic-associated virus]
MVNKRTSNVKSDKASSSRGPVAENTIILGSGTKLRSLRFTDVTNGRLNNSEQSELKTTPVALDAFTSASQHVSRFTLHDYRSYCNVDMVAAHLSRSKEIKEQLAKRNITLTTASGINLVVVKDLNESTITNIVSFNKACAIMSAGILKHKVDNEFDWTKTTYVATKVEKKADVNPLIINRLAGQMGMIPTDAYYWFIVPGYEFLYELYPAEVIAYTLVRLEYRKQLNIPDSMTDSDIVSSLVMKMNRFHNLEANSFDDSLKVIGEHHISEAYIEFAKRVGTTSKTKRNDDAIEVFKKLIAQLTPALEVAKLKGDVEEE